MATDEHTDSRDQESRRDTPVFQVVVNNEEQYSIWDARRELPRGWHEAGFQGPEEACLAHIDAVWTDMRPLSLRGEPDA